MAIKFTATVVIVATGEVDLQADNVLVYTKAPLTILFPVMTINDDAMAEMPAEARQMVNQIIAQNVTKAAATQMKVPGFVAGEPLEQMDVPPEGRS